MRLGTLGVALLITTIAIMTPPAQAEGKAAINGVGEVDHVFVIVLENHSRNSLIDYAAVAKQCKGSGHVGYFTSLACKYASAAEYYGVTHPSLPNYIAMISGSNWGINSDKLKPPLPLKHTNLVDQLEAAHKTWAAYMEALPDGERNKLIDFWPGSPDQQLYASKHNPFIMFKSIRGNKARLENIKPYTDISRDLESETTTPNFAYIVPDQCNDMHGGVNAFVPGHLETPCPHGNEVKLRQNADRFVKHTLAQIMHSKAWKNSKSVIFIIADEGDYDAKEEQNGKWDSPKGCCDSPVVPKGASSISAKWPGGMYGGGRVPAIIIVSKGGKHDGYVSKAPYNHYSLLATIEDIWHLGLLGYTSDTEQVKPMTEFLTK